MAVIQVDQFSYDDNGIVVIDVFLNTDANQITYTGKKNGSPIFPAFVTEDQRGHPEGTSIFNYYTDTKKYNIFSSNNAPFAYFTDEPYTPNPPQCDLLLNISLTNETSQGANNGTATIIANTSFSNPKVSITRIGEFNSPHTFLNLAPGIYTANGSDSNGCTKSQQIEIVAFDNPISGGFEGGSPQVDVSPGNTSRWNAAYNPIVFNFNKTPDLNKKNFRYEIEITSEQGIVVGTWSPNTKGFCRADISAYLQGLVNANDDFKYDVINYRDLNRAASFTIRYREVWDGDSSVWFSAPQPFYVTYSANQLGSRYAGNMAQYVPFLNELSYENKAKFLTGFNEPTAWVGLPFDLSFIFSEYIIGQNLKMRTISLDINKNPIAGGIINSYLLNNDAGYILASDLGRLIIKEGALPPVSNDGILDQLGINRLMLAGDPANNVHYFAIQLYTGDDTDPNFVTQQIIVKINKQCKDPYVYLKWLNTLGGWDYWRFGKDQIVSLNTSNGVEIDRNVFDWENDETIADVIQKQAVERITIGAILPVDKSEGVKQVATSIKVQMLSNTNPYKWETVIVNVGQFEVKSTRLGFSDVKFTISRPEMNIQRQ